MIGIFLLALGAVAGPGEDAVATPSPSQISFHRGTSVSLAVDKNGQPLASERTRHTAKGRYLLQNRWNKAWTAVGLNPRPVPTQSLLLYSASNDNQTFTLQIVVRRPKGGGTPLYLRLRGRVYPSTSWSDDGGKVTHYYELDRAAAAAVSSDLNIPQHMRPDLGKHVTTQFRLLGAGAAAEVEVTVTNSGTIPVGVEFGGMYRGSSRDNRFNMRGTRGGKTLPDVGNSMNFGGLGGYHTLVAGASTTYKAPVSKWVPLAEAGTYALGVQWLLQLVEADGHRTSHPKAARWEQWRKGSLTLIVP